MSRLAVRSECVSDVLWDVCGVECLCRRSLAKKNWRSVWYASESRTRRSSSGDRCVVAFGVSLSLELTVVLQDVQADEDEYKKKQEAERAKQAKAKKVQESVDKAREQNARRKMDKVSLCSE